MNGVGPLLSLHSKALISLRVSSAALSPLCLASISRFFIFFLRFSYDRLGAFGVLKATLFAFILKKLN